MGDLGVTKEFNSKVELAVKALNTDDGVNAACYQIILDSLNEKQAVLLNKNVRATDGFYYLPEGTDFESLIKLLEAK